jgi:hypothetical protein
MYLLSDKQIDYILSDIRARGVEMESLQQNLLDHICCIMEQNLEVQGDFESFYQKTIKTFYKDALWEIEEETISLLTFKNYYTMKKIMITSGIFSAITMILGIIFKFMHWPGAAFFIILGILSSSLVFLPLLFTLKAREKQNVKDRLILGIGGLSAILMSLSILFKVMHWPYSFPMANIAIGMMGLLFLPIYFFTGTRNPETKVNTIASSVIIILGCGLHLTLIRTPQSSLLINIKNTHDFVRSQQILQNEQRQLAQQVKQDTSHALEASISSEINRTCENLKSFILKSETGYNTIDENFENKKAIIEEHSFGTNPFLDNPTSTKDFNALAKLVEEYNSIPAPKNVSKIPTKDSFIQYFNNGPSFGSISTISLLNQLTQIQMFVLQNQRELLASR